MSVTKVETQSWFSRLKQSVMGVLVGLGLLLAMLMLLFWNEGRAVKTARGLSQGASDLVMASPQQVDPALEGKLVYLVGEPLAPVPLHDTHTGVSAPGLRLQRKVEMYQWVQDSQSKQEVALGGTQTTTTQYSYNAQWSEQAVDSSRFEQAAQYSNPAMALRGESFLAEGVQLGSWTLDAPVLGQLGAGQAYPVSQYDLVALQHAIGPQLPVQLVDGQIHVGANPQAPAVGDYRISYSLVPVQALSIIGRQTGHGIRPWQADSGSQVLMVQTGVLAAEQMFSQAHSGNSSMTWIFRALGTLLLVIAINMVLGPLSVAASVLPVLSRVLAMGTGLIATCVGVALSVFTMALAWIFYRPLLALAIIAVGIALVAAVVKLIGKRRRQLVAMPPPVSAS